MKQKHSWFTCFLDTGYFYLSIVLLAGALIYAGYKAIEPHINKTTIPFANDMAKEAMLRQTESPTYQQLEQHIAGEIESTARHGGREVEVYVGEFDRETVKEGIRQLAFRGYRTELTSPLSGTDDFLRITW